MALNYIWIGFFLIAFVVALIKFFIFGDMEIFNVIVNSTMDTSRKAFQTALFLTGILSLWLGILKIGEKGGMVNIISRAVGPFFSKLFPEIPKNHPSIAAMVMNISANMLGLGNAATPLGLKAMEEMQKLNPNKDTATNAQIMFLVLNTSGLTLIPITVMALRAEYGAAHPSDIFIPIIITTFFSTMAGLIAVSLIQKINLLNKTVLIYLGTLTLLISGTIVYFYKLTDNQINTQSSALGNFIILSIIVTFIILAVRKKVNVYEAFVEGAKEGFSIAVKIIPFLVAMLVAIGVFTACGAMDFLILGLSKLFVSIGVNTDFVPALPTAFIRPLSGSGAIAMLTQTLSEGADSFHAKVASVMLGSTETTFYVIAVYFGSVSIRNTRYAVTCGLIADFAGITTAILISYLFFH